MDRPKNILNMKMKKIIGILGILLVLSALVCVTGEYAPIPGDIDHDGKVSDGELLRYIDSWVVGRVSDTNLLISIDFWSMGQ